MTSVKPLRYGKVDSDICILCIRRMPYIRPSAGLNGNTQVKSVSDRLTEGYINTDNAENKTDAVWQP